MRTEAADDALQSAECSHVDPDRRDPAGRGGVLLAGAVGAPGGRAAVRARRHHGLPGRLSRAPAQADLQFRRVPGSGRGQADRGHRARAARAEGSAPVVAIAAAIIIGREITVSALREWMSQIGARSHVAVSWFGKWKTASQIVGIRPHAVPGAESSASRCTSLGEWLLYAAVALTLWSMIDYLRAAGPVDAGERLV